MEFIIPNLISSIALLISILAYIKNIQDAKLNLFFNVYMTNQRKNKRCRWHKSDVFLSRDVIDKSRISMCRTGAEINFTLINTGKRIAKNPVIVFEFIGIEVDTMITDQLKLLFEDVKMRDHMHGLGYYTTFQCKLGDNYYLYPKVPINLNPFCLNKIKISESGSKIIIYLLAENAKTQKKELYLNFLD